MESSSASTNPCCFRSRQARTTSVGSMLSSSSTTRDWLEPQDFRVFPVAPRVIEIEIAERLSA